MSKKSIMEMSSEEILLEAQQKVKHLSTLTQKYHPYNMLLRAFYWVTMEGAKPRKQTDLTSKQLWALRTLEFVQNNYASLSKDRKCYDELTDEAWKEIVDAVQSVNILMVPISIYAKNYSGKGGADTPDELLSKELWHLWNIRGNDFEVHRSVQLEELLEPHDAIFNKLFGIGVSNFVEELKKIENSLCFGIYQNKIDYDKHLKKVNKIGVESITMDHPLRTEIKKIVNKTNGLGLCDVGEITNLPKKLLDYLSWEQGEDIDYWKSGMFPGFPLRSSPIRRRPFLNLNGKYYCFEAYQLFDNIYRVMERIIKELDCDYRMNGWGNRQGDVSEDITFNLMMNLLPNAQLFHKSVHYGNAREKTEGEVDAIIAYDRVLIIVEVKAGASFSASPIEKIKEYKSKLQEMITAPVTQAEKFLSYIDSKEIVNLYDGNDSNANLIDTIDRSLFDTIIIFAVSVDSISHIVSSGNFLEYFGVDISKKIIPISMADIRIYVDIFKNKPIAFFHYLSERTRVVNYRKIVLPDETDHIGAYIKLNNTTKAIRAAPEADEMTEIYLGGYDGEIYMYYNKRFFNRFLNISVPVEPPGQRLPPEIRDIIDALERDKAPGHVWAGEVILSGSEKFQNDICIAIKKATSENDEGVAPSGFIMQSDGDRMILINSYFRSTFHQVPDELVRITVGYAYLILLEREKGISFELYFKDDNSLCMVIFHFFDAANLEKFPPNEKKAIEQTALEIKSAFENKKSDAPWKK